MAKKIDNYTSEIREKNKHFFINGSNIEHGFNIYDDKEEGRPFFNTLYTRNVGHYMKNHPKLTVDQMLKSNDMIQSSEVKNSFKQ